MAKWRLAAWLTLAVSAANAQGPTRPPLPVKMDALSDEQFGRLFFAEVDLDCPEMAAVKPLVAAGDWTGALAAWSRPLLVRLRAMPLSPWPYVNWYPLDELMGPDRVIMRHGHPKDFGPVGHMDWYGLRDWELHVNFMWHPKAISGAIEKGGSRYTHEQLYTRWAAIWRDYVNNNWRAGLPLSSDPALRQRRLEEAGLTAPPNEWGLTIAFRQQLCLAWPLGNWFVDLQHACRAAPADFDRFVSPRVLAEMVYFNLVWPVENLVGGATDGARLAGGAPNQTDEKATQLLRLALVAPEFRRGKRLGKLAGELIKAIVGVEGFRCAGTDHQPDGSGTELSYNYMKALAPCGEEWLSLARRCDPAPDWVEPLRRAVEQRRRFMANLRTPTGWQVLCKGTHEGKSEPVPTPAYTSLAFPYHGLYMQRSGWDREALFLSLHNPRRGQGHGAEDGNKLMLEAFGRYILVASGGEDRGRYTSSSWAQNTINLDGLGQARNAWPVHGAWDTPEPGRWHTSPHFDFAESTYTYGWGWRDKPAAGQPPVVVSDTPFTRQVVFVKDAGLWLVVDLLDAPTGATHRYSQLWHFHKDFPRATVVASEADLAFQSADPAGANLFAYQAGPVAPRYRLCWGEGNSTGDARPRGDKLPDTARGWHNVGSGYDAGDVYPAVDLHAEWQGAGRQVLLTALVPSRTTASPVAQAERLAGAGLVLTLADGRVVRCEAAAAALSVLTSKPGEPARGLTLGAVGTTGEEFEVAADGARRKLAEIGVPRGFRWVGPPERLVPAYLAGD